MNYIDESKFINICENSKSMREASIKLNLPFTTFRRYAKKLGVYKTNQSGKGLKKAKPKIPLVEIFEGKHPTYKTCHLHKRMVQEGFKEEKCEVCGLTEWLGKSLSFDLHHIDGNNKNHSLENLQMICPNCHSQTSTYRARNKQ